MMTTEPRPTFDVELAAGEAKFLAIYRPMRPLFEGAREKYGLTFPAEAVPDAELLWGVGHGRRKRAFSTARPCRAPAP